MSLTANDWKDRSHIDCLKGLDIQNWPQLFPINNTAIKHVSMLRDVCVKFKFDSLLPFHQQVMNSGQSEFLL